MILYHFTHPANVPIISASGLEPGAKPDIAFMTGGIPVVWLTLEESNVATADLIAHMEKVGERDRNEGELTYGGTARLTVNLSRADKRLIPYRELLRQNGCDMTVMRSIHIPVALTKWWVYLGVIPPHKIDTTIPAALALESIDHHINTHPDLEVRARFKNLRDQVALTPPDHPFRFDVMLDEAS